MFYKNLDKIPYFAFQSVIGIIFNQIIHSCNINIVDAIKFRNISEAIIAINQK